MHIHPLVAPLSVDTEEVQMISLTRNLILGTERKFIKK